MRSVCPHPPAPPLTPLPPAAVGAILLAEGYARLTADWHLEWMLPETLEEELAVAPLLRRSCLLWFIARRRHRPFPRSPGGTVAARRRWWAGRGILPLGSRGSPAVAGWLARYVMTVRARPPGGWP